MKFNIKKTVTALFLGLTIGVVGGTGANHVVSKINNLETDLNAQELKMNSYGVEDNAQLYLDKVEKITGYRLTGIDDVSFGDDIDWSVILKTDKKSGEKEQKIVVEADANDVKYTTAAQQAIDECLKTRVVGEDGSISYNEENCREVMASLLSLVRNSENFETKEYTQNNIQAKEVKVKKSSLKTFLGSLDKEKTEGVDLSVFDKLSKKEKEKFANIVVDTVKKEAVVSANINDTIFTFNFSCNLDNASANVVIKEIEKYIATANLLSNEDYAVLNPDAKLNENITLNKVETVKADYTHEIFDNIEQIINKVQENTEGTEV